jgi:hypothetical protein
MHEAWHGKMLHQLSSYGFLQHENDIPQNFTTLQIQAHEEKACVCFHTLLVDP